jgi:tetrahydromethanopterin S-methyltransferase subunit C
MALGFSMRQTRYIIFAISLSFFTLNMVLFGFCQLNINMLVLIDAIIWIMMNVMISNKVHYLRSIEDPIALKFTDIGSSLRFKRRKRRN